MTLPVAPAAPIRTPTPRFQRPQPAQAPNRPLQFQSPSANPLSVFQYLACLYLFLYFSRLIEFFPAGLRPIAVFSVVLLAGALISGRILALFGTFAGKAMGLFLLWNWVCAVFSVWPGGSVKLCFDTSKLILSVMIVVAYTNSLRAALMLIGSTAVGLGAAALFPSFSGETIVGRTSVGTAGGSGTLSDPNFFCLFLLSGLPLLWLTAKMAPRALKVVPLGLSLIAAAVAVQTGSRGGFVAIAVGMLYFLSQTSGQQRAKILAGIGIATIMVILFAPRTVLVRLTTMIKFDQGRAQTEEELKDAERAAGSTDARLNILKRSIAITLRHPIFGVGPGMFAIADAQVADVENERAAWLETHNVFTECSSGTGLIGLGLFIATLASAFRSLRRIRTWTRMHYHPLGEKMYDAAFYLQICMVILFTAGMFLSILYMSTWWLLIGLTIGLSLACHYEIAAYENQRAGRAAVLQRT